VILFGIFIVLVFFSFPSMNVSLCISLAKFQTDWWLSTKIRGSTLLPTDALTAMSDRQRATQTSTGCNLITACRTPSVELLSTSTILSAMFHFGLPLA
jgi:hypothetical protein